MSLSQIRIESSAQRIALSLALVHACYYELIDHADGRSEQWPAHRRQYCKLDEGCYIQCVVVACRPEQALKEGVRANLDAKVSDDGADGPEDCSTPWLF